MAAACASAAEIPLTRNLVFDFCVLSKLRERPASSLPKREFWTFWFPRGTQPFSPLIPSSQVLFHQGDREDEAEQRGANGVGSGLVGARSWSGVPGRGPRRAGGRWRRACGERVAVPAAGWRVWTGVPSGVTSGVARAASRRRLASAAAPERMEAMETRPGGRVDRREPPQGPHRSPAGV